MKELGKGGKYKMAKPIDLGLSESSSIEGGSKMPLRGENNIQQQRPVGTVKTVSSDRGSFKSKC